MNEHTFYNIFTYIIAKDFYGICNVCKNVCVVHIVMYIYILVYCLIF